MGTRATGQGAPEIATVASASGARRYDKGERRHKHSGRGASAAVDLGNPKRVVGKCPNNIPQTARERLLQDAIAATPIDPDMGYSKHLYLSFGGAIYECATSDFGVTYHAYPYHGPLLRSLVDRLRGLPDAQSHPLEFDRWLDDHVKVRG